MYISEKKKVKVNNYYKHIKHKNKTILKPECEIFKRRNLSPLKLYFKVQKHLIPMEVNTPKLSCVSREFSIVEYLLQLQLNAPQLKVSECYDISNKKSDKEFTNYVKQMRNTNIVDVFIPLSTLKQPLSDIIKRGIRVNTVTGLRIHTNGIRNVDRQEDQEVVHVTVALGSILNYGLPGCTIREVKYNIEAPRSNQLPHNYDSLRVSEDNDFVIFHPNQVKAAHLVRFKGGKNLTHQAPVFNRCAVCGLDNAVIWCENDCVKLCKNCDEETHMASRVAENHTRVPISDSNKDFQVCPLHPGQRVQYYCTVCNCPVCLECKVHGTHSKGEAARHRLTHISEAFANKRLDLEVPKKAIEHRGRLINARIDQARHRLDELEVSEDRLISKIKKVAQNAIEGVHNLFLLKANEIKSIKVELERKALELKDMKRMIELHRVGSEPLDLMAAAYANTCLETEMENVHDLPLPPSNTGEVVIEGELRPSISKDIFSLVSDKGIEVSETDDSVVTSTYKLNESVEVEVVPRPRNPKPRITSLKKMAAKREEKYANRGLTLGFEPFKGSEVIDSPSTARMLYMCLPFKAQPQTKLIFSSTRDGRSIQQLHRNVDGIGITAVIVKSGENIFGGFAASRWNSDGVPFGQNTSTFLFSLDKDAFIPYRGLSDEPVVLFGDQKLISFGKEDLKLVTDFNNCGSVIENNYGVGFEYDSHQARTFLAGSPSFKADVVEVWGFFSQ